MAMPSWITVYVIVVLLTAGSHAHNRFRTTSKLCTSDWTETLTSIYPRSARTLRSSRRLWNVANHKLVPSRGEEEWSDVVWNLMTQSDSSWRGRGVFKVSVTNWFSSTGNIGVYYLTPSVKNDNVIPLKTDRSRNREKKFQVNASLNVSRRKELTTSSLVSWRNYLFNVNKERTNKSIFLQNGQNHSFLIPIPSINLQ